jgi:hypothetical protein
MVTLATLHLYAVKIPVVAGVVVIFLGGDHKLVVSSSDQIVIVYRDISVRTGESDRNSFGLSRWQAVRVKLIRAPLVADTQTREIRVVSHDCVGPLHLAAVADSDRQI